MKYGETLRQRSIPAWSHHNIDYDEIKHFIKENTTPGKGKAVSVPGRADDQLQELDNALFAILVEQHDRITAFVKSKTGEIERRLDHANKQLQRIAARRPATGSSIPVGRLERYGRLESDVLQAGKEIKSLARFTTTQRTAFRKLLKKYKKWTGSTQLEDRFNKEVLGKSSSFTKYNLDKVLDAYSVTLHDIRALFEQRMQHISSNDASNDAKALPQVSQQPMNITEQLLHAVDNGSKVSFDHAMATMPFGDRGTIAHYFVHPDNVVELQVLLLQHARYAMSSARATSSSTPTSTSPSGDSQLNPKIAYPSLNRRQLIADDLDRFVEEQRTITVNQREHAKGSIPQKAKLCARWTEDEEALVAAKIGKPTVTVAGMKRKHVSAFLDTQEPYPPRRASTVSKNESGTVSFEDAMNLRKWLADEKSIRPLATIASRRSRYLGLSNGVKNVVLSTLDTNIITSKPVAETSEEDSHQFPYAVLQVRQEGATVTDLTKVLDQSHLAERVRGFSLEYHAVWQNCQDANIPEPFWIPMLSTDIRKLPPPIARRSNSAAETSGNSQSTTSNASVMGVTDSTTAVEGMQSSAASEVADQLEAPPISSFRKKRKRPYAPLPPKQTYWSEYDHPEDGSDNGDAYVIYIDPNETSTISKFFGKISRIFVRRSEAEDSTLTSPTTPDDDETSSDEEASIIPRRKSQHGLSYGTLPQHSRSDRALQGHRHRIPHLTAICLVASMTILVVAYILAMTGKHKLARQVEAGVLFSIVSSLIFAVIGVVSLLGQRGLGWIPWTVAIGVLTIDAVGAGGLLAWMLG